MFARGRSKQLCKVVGRTAGTVQTQQTQHVRAVGGLRALRSLHTQPPVLGHHGQQTGRQQVVRQATRQYEQHSHQQSSHEGLASLLDLRTLVCSGAAIVFATQLLSTSGPYEMESMGYKDKVAGNYENRIRQNSNFEKVFEYFASKKKGGKYFMTVDDFMRSITPFEYHSDTASTLLDKKSFSQQGKTGKTSYIAMADTDGDGLIDFDEYMFFLTLLRTPPQFFEIAFRMFDLDGNGVIDRTEFNQVMIGFSRRDKHSKMHSTLKANSGLVLHFFGEKGQGKLDLPTFLKFLNGLREEVLQREFDHFDPEGTGTISVQDFMRSTVGYARMRDLPRLMLNIKERLNGNEYRINFRQFHEFNTFLDHLDEVEIAIQLVTKMGDSLTPDLMKQAAKAIAGVELEDEIVEAVFTVFDDDRSGTLEGPEFVHIVKHRSTRGLSKPRSGSMNFLKAITSCIRDSLDV